METVGGADVQFIFGDHTLDTERRELLYCGAAIAVQPQVFDLLVYLMQNRERVVSKDDLIALVWRGRIVSDSTLASRINAARIAIGDSGKDQKLIRTISRKGFRFVAGVTEQLHDIQPADAPPTENQPLPALPLPDRPAIAVLPFNNMSGDREQEYFSDGISEDIITALSKLRWFFVIARNSSFIYKRKAVHLKQIAEELGVLDRRPVAMEAGLRPRALSGGLSPGGLGLISGQRGHRSSHCSRARVFAASSRA